MSYASFCSELYERSLFWHHPRHRLANLKCSAVFCNADLFIDLLVDFYFIFRTLEDNLRKYADHPCVNGVVPEDLLRTEALERDLEYHLGAKWRDLIQASALVESYCDRIVKVATRDPTLMIAYTHTLYLVLLEDGATIRMMIHSALELPDDEGMTVFSFDPLRHHFVMETFKKRLNNLTISRPVKEIIVEEKQVCFELNNAIFSSHHPSRSRSYHLLLNLTTVFAFVSLIFYAVRLRWRR